MIFTLRLQFALVAAQRSLCTDLTPGAAPDEWIGGCAAEDQGHNQQSFNPMAATVRWCKGRNLLSAHSACAPIENRACHGPQQLTTTKKASIDVRFMQLARY